MARNYLKRFSGDQINALMAASAFNFRRLLRKLKILPGFLFRWIPLSLLRTVLSGFTIQKRRIRESVEVQFLKKLPYYLFLQYLNLTF